MDKGKKRTTDGEAIFGLTFQKEKMCKRLFESLRESPPFNLVAIQIFSDGGRGDNGLP